MQIRGKAGGVVPRSLLIVLLAGVEFIWVLCLIQLFKNPNSFEICLFLGMQFVLLIFIATGLYQTELVTLSETGVSRKLLFREKHYLWEDIKQAGVVYVRHNNMNNEFYFVLTPKGGPMRPKNDWRYDGQFYRTSLGKNVIIPFFDEVEAWICEHYGELDYDDRKKTSVFE